MIPKHKWMEQALEDHKNQDIDEFTGKKKRPKKTEFKFSNGLPGTFKTTAIIKVTDEWAKKNKGSVHAVPSKLLSKEVAERHKVKCVILNSDTVNENESVGQRLKSALKDGLQDPLIVTHHAILNTEKLPISDYTLFFDELFDPTIHFEISVRDTNLKETIKHLLDIPSINQRYSKIVTKNNSKIWDTIYSLRGTKFEEDETNSNQLERLLTFIARSNHFIVYSHNSFNKSVLEGDGEKFVATAFVKPDLFYPWKEVRFSAAGFEHSLLYFLWNKLFGIEWTKDNQMMKYLREPLKRKIIVRYWLESRGWSKTFGKQNTLNPGDAFVESMLDKFYADTETYLKSEGITQVLLAKNKDDDHSLNGISVENLPFGSYGLNSFTHHHTFIEAGAYLKPNAFYELMEWLGFKKESKSEDAERIYQNLYRTGIRVAEKDEVWTLIIPSKNLFPKYFYERFDVIDAKKFGSLVEEDFPKAGRPKGSNKVDPSISARRQYLINNKSKINAILKKQGVEFEKQKIIATIFDAPTVDPTDEVIETFPALGDRHEFCRVEFYEFLKQESKKKVQKKYQNLSFALVDYEDNRRGHTRASQVYGAVFDFDATEEEGFITPERVKAVLGEIEFFLYPSFSGGFKNRLVILFREGLSPQEAESLIESIHHVFLETYPKCKSDQKSFCFAQTWFLPRNNPGTHINGEVFDAREYLHGSVAWGLSQAQKERDFQLAIQPSVGVSENAIFTQKILPKLSEMGKNNRYNLGEHLVGVCKWLCPTMGDKLIEEFKNRGMSDDHISQMKKLMLVPKTKSSQ
jgi:hypothetical protein